MTKLNESEIRKMPFFVTWHTMFLSICIYSFPMLFCPADQIFRYHVVNCDALTSLQLKHEFFMPRLNSQ
jgi:hypothetical protein